MLTRYRDILSLPGAFRFSSLGVVARMPISMLGLGIVLLISATTGAYGLAGAVSGVYVIAVGVGAPLQGRAVDRLGQHRVLPLLAAGQTAGMIAFMVAAGRSWPVWTWFVPVAVAGVTAPQIGAAVRSRWSHLTRGDDLQTAFALESVFDEVVFVTGPIVVTVLATIVDRYAGIGLAITVGVAGVFVFAAQRRTEPPAHPVGRDGDRVPLGVHRLAPIVAVMISIGAVFGANDVVVVAFATDAGVRSAAGAILAVFSIGSLLSGLVTGAIRWRRSPIARMLVGALLLLGTTSLLPLSPSIPVLLIFAFLVGSTVCPTLVAASAAVERAVPRVRLAEGFTWTSSGLTGGVAIGSAIAGHLIDAFGPHLAYVASPAAALVAVGAAVVSWRLAAARSRATAVRRLPVARPPADGAAACAEVTVCPAHLSH